MLFLAFENPKNSFFDFLYKKAVFNTFRVYDVYRMYTQCIGVYIGTTVVMSAILFMYLLMLPSRKCIQYLNFFVFL
jgi:hypothetical protein